MSDITKCTGSGTNKEGISVDCPMKQTCYRHTATANEYRQAYFTIIPLVVDCCVSGQRIFETCDYYWENEK